MKKQLLAMKLIAWNATTRYLQKSRNSHFIWKSPANAGLFSGGGYVQDERYTAGAGRAGAVPFRFARRLTQGGGESGDRSKSQDLLFSADYADYADYCMRLAWAMRTTAGMQEVEHQE